MKECVKFIAAERSRGWKGLADFPTQNFFFSPPSCDGPPTVTTAETAASMGEPGNKIGPRINAVRLSEAKKRLRTQLKNKIN